MRHLSVSLFLILAIVYSTSVDAQNLTDNWRVLTKTITHQNGEKNVYEYLYSYDNRIKSVKYLSSRGSLFLSIINFNFNSNNKPESYTVQYSDGSRISVRVKYDNQGRISELEKVFGREISVFNYTYSATSIIITQKISNSANPIEKGNTITLYSEKGDFNNTTSDPLTQTITSVITLNKNRESEIFPHPDEFMGGFEPPRFLGVLAFGSEPKITATKDENGLITSLSYIARGSNRTFDYTYIKVRSSEPVTTIPIENIPVTIITTNINCAAGKEVVERILKSQDGVQSVKVDIKTGKVSLAYSSDGTPYTEIINLINEAGFNADRNKSEVPNANPCKATTVNTFNIANLKKIYQLREASASPELKQRLMQQRLMISQNNFKYQVANTGVSEHILKDITGFTKISRPEILRLRDIDKSKPFNPDVASFLKNYKPTADASLSQFDARNYIKIQPIREQKCASCWAYVAVGLLEISYMAQKGYATTNSIDLSEKQVLGCSAAGTCDGGWHFKAFEWMKNTNQKLLLEKSLKDDDVFPKKSSLPDAGFVDVLCNVADVKQYFLQLADWGIVQKDKDLDKVANEYEIKDAVVKYGAVGVSLYASPVFQSYASVETFEENEIAYKDSAVNHVVIIIGWDNKKQAWLIRNSWGKNWGDDGYGWVKYTTNHIGKHAIWGVAKIPPPLRIPALGSENIKPISLIGELVAGIHFPEGSTLASPNGMYEFKNSNNSILFITNFQNGSTSYDPINPFNDFSSIYKLYSDIPLTGSTAASPFYLQDTKGNLFTPFGKKPFKKLELNDSGNLIAYGTDDGILWSLKPVPPKIRRK
ncbi:MAG: C1 family peptidase [Chitinophagaceae bacterium]